MQQSGHTVIGIDVGGAAKGFHAVALQDGRFVARAFGEVPAVVDWCRSLDAQAIAIDAPCAWSASGGSRLAERALQIGGVTIQCFKTPLRDAVAKLSPSGQRFYGWVFRGEALYQALAPHYALFDGMPGSGRCVFETFPHAVACALAGHVIPASPKAATRRKLLREAGYDDVPLANIDFVDAALCALTAERFLTGRAQWFGDVAEGFIVVPGPGALPAE